MTKSVEPDPAEKFTQKGPLRKVTEESFRDLPLKKQRERMRAMYRDVKPEEPK